MRRTIPVLLMLATAPACARVGLSEPVVADRPIKLIRDEVPGKSGIHPLVKQDGTIVVLRAVKNCDVRKHEVVERKTTRTRVNETLGIDWIAGAAGVVAAAVGVGFLVDAGKVYPNDRTSRTYNPTGPDKARLYGIGLMGAGAALMAIPVVDATRASGTVEDTGTVEESKGFAARGIPCHDAVFAHITVSGLLGDHEYNLGHTNERGLIRIDLDKELPDKLRMIHEKMALDVGGLGVGNVDLAPLFKVRSARAWNGLDTDLCKTPTDGSACNRVVDFLRQYPHGPHSDEARKLLVGARDKIIALRDDAAWQDVPVKACSAAKRPDDIDRACEQVHSYLERFPDGRHADEARKIVKKADARKDAITKKAERAEQAEAQKDHAQEVRQCRARCKVGCSTWRIRDPGACYSGCVEAQCQ